MTHDSRPTTDDEGLPSFDGLQRGRIDAAQRCLGWCAGSRDHALRWSAIESLRVCSTRNLWDEIALVIPVVQGGVFVTETQDGYQEFFDALHLQQRLDGQRGDWYSAVEAGAILQVKLRSR